MEPNAAAENYLYDFIYLNHEALSFCQTQLDDDGLLTGSVVTRSSGEQMRQQVGGSVKVIHGTHEETGSHHSSRQNSFDTSKNLPLDVMRELNARGLIHDITQAKPGQIVLLSGRMQMVDLVLMNDLLEPALDMELSNMPSLTDAHRRKKREKAEENGTLIKMFSALPKLLQVRIFDDTKSAWCTIRHVDMMQDSFSIAMKHGVTVRGQWHVLAVLDALPDDTELDEKAFEYMTDLDNGYFTALLHIRTMMGRRFNEYGISPLAIFRKLT